MIMDHLRDTTVANSLETICTEIGQIQRTAQTGGGGGQKNKKEVQLVQTEGYRFLGTCSHCGKKAGHKRKDCPEQKASKPKAKGAGGGGAGNHNGKKCNFYGGEGHVEDGCWKKKPDLAPDWLKKKLKDGNKAASLSVEIMLASVEETDFAKACM